VGRPADQDGRQQLTEEGHYGNFGTAGARTEMPGCSLCMGNQAQVKEGATVLSTSTRNFPNRLGKNTNVYLGRRNWPRSARAGPHPDRRSTWPTWACSTPGDKIYQYLNFDKIGVCLCLRLVYPGTFG
jgi:aconitate hydratase 2/2-methylisocitrate dehydratase